MPVAIKGSGGGSVTLDAGAASADTTLTLPNTTGTVALTASPTFTGTVTIPTLSVTGASTLTGTVTTTTITSPSATALTLQYGGTTGATLDTSGNLLVGTTSPLAGARISVKSSTNVIIGQCDNGLTNILTTNTSGTSSYNGAVFCNNGTSFSTCGTISVSGSSVAYNTSSDYRLKENVAPMTNGLATVAALKPVTYDWVTDKSQGEGFIAHELAETIPLAVSGEKDAVNEDGSIRPQGVDYSKIVVHLVAALQELSAKNDALEARLAALEAK